MIYLISQILLCLALAALLGGAIGWLLQRSRANARLAAARRVLAEQARQLERARTDVTMLTDDFDDLRERSREEIDALRQENRQLPALTENLEKSQLLVRQMIQRHDSQTRELEAMNAALDAQIARLQEQVVTQERALAEAARAARARAAGDDAAGAAAPDTGSASLGLAADGAATIGSDAAEADGPTADASPDAPVPTTSAAPADATTPTAPTPARGRASLPLVGGDGADEIMDEVMEVDDDLAAELLGDADARTPDAPDVAAERASGSGTARRDGAADAAPSATIADPSDRDDDAVVPAAADAAADDAFDDAWDEDEDGNATLAIEVFSMDDVHGVEDLDDTARSARVGTDADASDEARSAPLFRPVGRQDDLKRIVGIGAVTEKALNELGITSYSQLAELERPEVEKIAAALDIGPERIERDDWVGNARRQLEDVLEEL